MSGADGSTFPAWLSPAPIARALTLSVRMGRIEIERDGKVSEGCWAMCEALLDALIEQLPDDPPRRR